MKENGCNNKNGEAGDSEPVPVLPLKANQRTDTLRLLFSARYEQEPEYYVRVPGRYELLTLYSTNESKFNARLVYDEVIIDEVFKLIGIFVF